MDRALISVKRMCDIGVLATLHQRETIFCVRVDVVKRCIQLSSLDCRVVEWGCSRVCGGAILSVDVSMERDSSRGVWR